MTTLHERELVALILVRAVEEHDPSFFKPEVLSESALAAIDARSDAELLEKRTSYLFLRLDKGVRAWARMALLPEDCLGFAALAGFLVGALSNYLGPSGFVHVAYNPLAVFIIWNVGIYALLAWQRLVHRRSKVPATSAGLSAVADSQRRKAVQDSGAEGERRGVLRCFLLRLWFAFNRWKTRTRSAGERTEMTSAFWDSYWELGRHVVIARAESLIHVAVIGLLLGAIVGTYVRGLFFEYNAVWRSTFVTEPTSVTIFLNVLLGPACLVIDGALLTPEAVQPLLLPQGAAAAAWIHRLALMGGLVVLLPRVILAGLAARHARAAAGNIEVDLSQGYFAEKIRATREGQIHRIRDGIANTIRRELGKFDESVGLFFRDNFFDKIVAPTLFRFRNKGGRICDLEAELSEHQTKFEPELQEHLRYEQHNLQEAIRTGVQAVVGRELSRKPSLLSHVSPGFVAMNQRVTGAVAANVGDAIGAAVTAAVAAAVATISGGIGKTLGVAILSSLLGTSGPIGLLIGGVAAAALVGGAYILGRDRVTSAVKHWRIPATIAAIAFRDSKLDQAREATYSQVKQEIHNRIDYQVADATEAILRQLSIGAGGTGRPGVA